MHIYPTGEPISRDPFFLALAIAPTDLAETVILRAELEKLIAAVADPVKPAFFEMEAILRVLTIGRSLQWSVDRNTSEHDARAIDRAISELFDFARPIQVAWQKHKARFEAEMRARDAARGAGKVTA